MFSFQSKVRFSETGSNEKLTLPAVMNYFQDCSELHSEAVGSGAEKLGPYAWILSSWQIQIHRYAAMSENIEICTLPHALKGVHGDRNFLIRDAQGEVLVNANSIWTYVNKSDQRPARVTPEQYEIYPLEEPYPMAYAPRKISLNNIPAEDFQTVGEVTVQPSYLDMFHHTNNSQYVTIACDFLPEGYSFNQIRIEYKKSALLHDTIVVKQYQSDDRLLCLLTDTDGAIFTVLEFQTVSLS